MGPNAQGETLDLARLITNFARSLVPLDNITTQVESVNHQQDLLVIHSLAHSAMIRLYSVRASAAPGGDLRDINVCLIHAGEILRVMEFLLSHDQSGDMVDPILGVSAQNRSTDVSLPSPRPPQSINLTGGTGVISSNDLVILLH